MLPGILFLIAVAVAVAANIWASYAPRDALDSAIIWTSLAFFVATFPLFFVPKRFLIAVWPLAIGGWAMMRFFGDIGDTHPICVLLIPGLVVFTVMLATGNPPSDWLKYVRKISQRIDE